MTLVGKLPLNEAASSTKSIRSAKKLAFLFPRLAVKCLSTTDKEIAFFPDRRVATELPIPCLQDCVHFINLTNGLEVLPQLHQLGISPQYCRIQSTACEQQNFEKLVNELDASLLLHLALGRCCLVYDFGSRNKKRGAPRALWYGIEFLQYALTKLWFGEEVPARAFLRGHDARVSFDKAIRSFSKPTKRRLRYFGQYCAPDMNTIQLYGVYSATDNDLDKTYHQDIARVQLTTPRLNPSTQTQGSSSFGPQLDPKTIDLLQGDVHQAAEELLGMRLFVGGLSHSEYVAWQERSGIDFDGVNVEL